MAIFHLARTTEDYRPVAVPPLVAPRLTVDGWTLSGTPLGDRVPRTHAGELTALLHCASMRVDTPWTYDRAAQLLEECGEPEQALAACDVWFGLPLTRRSAHKAAARALLRRRNRLRATLSATQGPGDGAGR